MALYTETGGGKHYGHGHWSTLFASFAAGEHGVELPDRNRLVVQVAKVDSSNIDGDPAPVWVDISARVTHLAWLTGDTSGRLSRWPVEQFTIVTADLTDLLEDFVDLDGDPATSTAPAPGMFARWGIQNGTLNIWRPRMSGVVDTITDTIAGRVRGWTFQCYGTLGYFAQVDYTIGASEITSGVTNINTEFATICAASSDVNAPWPWSEAFAAQDLYGGYGSYGVPSVVSGASGKMPNGSVLPKLLLLHRMADTQGMRLFNTPTGGIATELWDTATPSYLRVADETTIPVSGHSLVDGTILGDFKFASSQARTGGSLKFVAGGYQSEGIIDPTRYTKWWKRSDIQGWPIRDTISPTPSDSPSFIRAANLITKAAALLISEVRCERMSLDTARDPNVWKALTWDPSLWPGSTVTIERRRPGTAWAEATLYVNAVSGILDFTNGRARAQIDYTTRLVTA